MDLTCPPTVDGEGEGGGLWILVPYLCAVVWHALYQTEHVTFVTC